MVQNLIPLILLLCFLFLLIFRSWRVSSRVPANKDPSTLQAIHWGLLNGGRKKAALAAFTQWLVDGTVAWNDAERKYELEKTETDNPTLALIQAGAPMKQVLQSLEGDLIPYERQLQDWGLWCDDQRYEKRARWIRVGWWMLSLGFLLHCLWQLVNDRTFSTWLAYIMISFLQTAQKPPEQTREGRKLLKQFKRNHSFKTDETPEAMLPTAVAILGPKALYDSPYAVLIWVLATQT